MTLNGWIQIAIYFVVLTALVVPLGRFMARVFEGERTFLTPVFGPVERGLYRIAGVDETREQTLDHLHGRHAAVQRRRLPAVSTRSCASRAFCRSTRQACRPSPRT